MAEADRQRWDRRYADGSYTPRDEPSPFVRRWLEHVPRGLALDVATGTGRNARLLAAAGFDVVAVDVSPVAIERARAATDPAASVEYRVADLDGVLLDEVGLAGPWALVTVVRYRDERLWPQLVDALAPDGWLLVEHHLRTARDDVGGPTGQSFRIAPGELLEAARGLRVVHHEECLEPSDHPVSHGRGALFANARLAAVNGSPGY